MVKFNFLLVSVFVLFSSWSQQNERNSLRTEQAPFYHGVASGDPLNDRVIIWTRVTPDQINNDPIEVHWRMAKDTSMVDIVGQGTINANENRDYTVKVDVEGLEPATCYYFDFRVEENYSVRGRTITAPEGDNEQVRFAVVSCSNYQHGYFNAYRKIAERNDVQAVLHLGDYIYEYAAGGYSANIPERVHEPAHEIITLDDYRLRYSHYRLDQDLQVIHQQYPFICIWDDHESANDSWTDGAENHDDATQGDWHVRKNNSKQAYFEWLPIRKNPVDSSIYRKFEYGDLVNLYMLDTRLEGRDEQVGATSAELNDPSRTLLGLDQLNWLKNHLSTSTSRWNILGQQVMMAPLTAFGVTLNTDQWDGYPVERQDIYSHIINNNINNIVVLTGDIHTSWANDLPMAGYNASTGVNSAGVEFVTTSITSPGFPLGFAASVIQSFNNHCKWVNLTQRGYMVLDINKNRAQSEWYHIDDITTPGGVESFANAFFVNNNERHLNAANLTSVTSSSCLFAPELPYNPDDYAKITNSHETVLFGVYPNPFQDEVILHFGTTIKKKVDITIVDSKGRAIYENKGFEVASPSQYLKIYTSNLESGVYQVLVSYDDVVKTHRIIKTK